MSRRIRPMKVKIVDGNIIDTYPTYDIEATLKNLQKKYRSKRRGDR